MIITQKYHSAQDIDSEFIPSLEELLSDCVPSFEWLKEHELSAAENIHFNYYLFFGDKHNAPIGFAQVAIEQDRRAQNIFFKNFNKKKNEKIKKANWLVPGSFKEAIVFEPRYKNMAIMKASNIFDEFLNRDDINGQTLRFGQAYSELPEKFHGHLQSSNEKIIPDTLVKNQAGYKEYLDSLKTQTKNEIVNNWRSLHTRSFILDENNIFKEIFAYKNDGAKVYKRLRNDKRIRKYLKLNTTFYTLEKDKCLLGIVFLIKGTGHHYFYDFVLLSDNINPSVLHQMAIMNFYEREDSDRLHLLFEPTDHTYFTQVGFTFRKQIELFYKND